MKKEIKKSQKLTKTKNTDKLNSQRKIDKVEKETMEQIKKVELSKKRTVSNLKNKIKEEEKALEKKETIISKLRKEIRESEKILDNEKNVRKTGIIAFLIFCIIVMIASITLIDYSDASLQEKIPNFVIEIRNKSKQMTTYYGLFYKVLKCDYDNNLIFTTYQTQDPECPYEITYTDDFYTNPNGLKISRQQVEVINRYYRDLLNEWKTEEELNNAYKLSIEFNKIWWIKKEVNISLLDGSKAQIAVFSKLEMEDSIYKWKVQYNDEKYQKCVRLDEDGRYLFATYNNEQCLNDWEHLKLSKESCELVKKDKSFMKNIAKMNNLCE